MVLLPVFIAATRMLDRPDAVDEAGAAGTDATFAGTAEPVDRHAPSATPVAPAEIPDAAEN